MNFALISLSYSPVNFSALVQHRETAETRVSRIVSAS
jgi:hypothetical protein